MFSKAGAKVRTIFQTTKCFEEKVSRFNSILELKRVNTTLKGLTPYYIIYKGGKYYLSFALIYIPGLKSLLEEVTLAYTFME